MYLSLSASAAPLVGRDRELAILGGVLDAAVAGHGALALIGGEAGIGKTALAGELCREAEERGALVLVGPCYDLTETPPYGPWVESFARYPDDGRLPPLPEAFAVRGTVGAMASQDALFRQVLNFLAALCARQPLLLLLEDLQWADPASLDLLRFLARSIAALPVLLIVTYRSDELTRHHPLSPLLPLLVREAGAERVDLRPLEDDAVRALVEGRYRLGCGEADRLVAYLQRRAEGNALFVGEVLRALEEGGALARDGNGWRLGDLTGQAVPTLLRQVIEGRTGRLGEAAVRLLGVAAVIGQEVPLALWERVAEVDEEPLLGVIEHGVAAHLIAEVPDGMGVRFTHALIREALYEGVLATRRRRLHLHTAEALTAAPGVDPDAVASHFRRAGDERAALWLVRAGEQAQAAYAWVTAAARYEAALTLMEQQRAAAEERGWLLFTLSRLRRYTDPSGAVRALEAASALAQEAGDRELDAVVRCSRGVVLTYAGRRRQGVRELSDGVDVLEACGPDELARIVARTGITESWLRAVRGTWMLQAALVGHLAAVLASAARWATRAEPPRTTSYQGSPYADGWLGLGVAHAMTGDMVRAEEAIDRALETYRAISHFALIGAVASHTLRHLALPYQADRPGTCEQWAEIAVDGYRRAVGAWPDVREAFRAPLDLLQGRWDAPAFEQLAAVVATHGDRAEAAPLAQRARERGDGERAFEWVRTTLPAGPATEPGDCDLHNGLQLQRVAAALALDAHDLPQAGGWLEAHDRWLAWGGAVLGLSGGQALWAHYHRQAGDFDMAREHAERALSHATEPRQPLALLAAHRLLGELETEAGRYESAATHFDAALVLADTCAVPYERALTLLALAELRATMDDGDAALILLETVRAICGPLGAKPALARADALVARLAHVPSPAPAHPDGLTDREVAVLRLVAAGRSNRQIADTLFISERTVNRHLTNLYTKIDAHSKADATAYALRHYLA